MSGNERSLITGEYLGIPRRGSLPFGMYQGFALAYENTNLAAGANVVSLFTVPADRIRILTNLTFHYVGASTAFVHAYVVRSAVNYYAHRLLNSTILNLYHSQVFIPLIPADVYTLDIQGAAAGNDILYYLLGYDMVLES